MKIHPILPILLLLTIQGCTKEENTSFSDPSALAIDVSVENVRPRAIVSGQTFTENSKIAVVVKNSNNSETNYGTNGTKQVFTLSGTAWTTSPALTLTQAGKVIAYYPDDITSSTISTDYNTLTPDIQASIAMETVSNSNLKLDGNAIYISPDETDYLVGTGTDVSTNSIRSTVTLRHAMAMVAVRLIKGTTYSGTASLTKIEVANKSGGTSLSSGTVNVQTNDFTKGTKTVSYIRNLTYAAVPLTDGGVYIGFLAYPAILYEDGLATLTLTVEGNTHTLNLPGNEQGDLHWRAGNCILYDVTLHGTKVEITKVTIAPWISGSSSGDMEVQ